MADNFMVLGQEPKQIIAPGGTVEQAIEVTFQTIPSGQVGKVRIPQSMFSTDTVRAAIEAQAKLIEDVQAL